MNSKQELIEYIQSYNKRPGEYSLQELLEIGRMMRTLPKAEINWG